MKRLLIFFCLICNLLGAQMPEFADYDAGAMRKDGSNAADLVNLPGKVRAAFASITSDLDVYGSARFGNGTAAAPSVSFGSDPDTGIYRYGANSLGFSSNGAYAGRWSEVGNLLVATTTDDLANKLQVNGNAGVTGYLYTGKSGDGGVVMYQPSSTNASSIKTLAGGNMQIFSASGDIDIYNNLISAIGVRIKGNTGTVLINTTTDDGANKLQVAGNAAISNGASTAKILAADSMTTQLAIDGVYAIPGLVGVSQYANYTVLITNKSAPAAAKFWVSTTVIEEQDPSNLFTTTKNNPGTLNVYGEFGELRIQNKLGYAAAVNAVAFGTNS